MWSKLLKRSHSKLVKLSVYGVIAAITVELGALPITISIGAYLKIKY